jgi:glycosyltransferase 2 family protein
MGKAILRAGISGAFLALLFYTVRNDIPKIVEALANLNKPLAAVAVLIFFSTVLILARRLQLIFEAMDVRVRLTQSTNLTFIGYFFNNFLPTAVGGDIVKALCASRLTGKAMKCFTAVLMDRIFGLFTFIIIPSFSLAFVMKRIGNPRVPLIVYSFLALSVCSLLVLFHGGTARKLGFLGKLVDRFRHGEKLRQIYMGMHEFKHHKSVVAQAMTLSVLGQSVSIFVLYCLALALGSEANVVYFYLLIPIIHLLSMAPSLGGLGIREHAYVVFLSPYIGRQNAAALGILWLALLFLLSLIGGLIYLFRHDYHVRLREAVKKEGA